MLAPKKNALSTQKPWLWFCLSLLACSLTWAYKERVINNWEYDINVSSGRIIASMGDLYPRWVGTRELLLHGRNPYGPEVSHEIQMGFYGHPIIQTFEPGRVPVDEQRFVYPVFVAFLLAPTIHIPFGKLQIYAETLLALLVVASTFLWLGVLRWWPSGPMIGAIVFFVVGSPQVIQGMSFRQLALVSIFLIALSAWCISKNHLAVAGVCLALCTIKPQLVLLPVLWFLLWAAGDWFSRKRLLLSFAGTMTGLVVGGEFLLPGWIRYFFEGVAAYRKYFPTESLIQVAMGERAGMLLGAVVLLLFFGFAWQRRREDANSSSFLIVLATSFLVTTIALPLLPPFNQILLILPALIVLRDWRLLPFWLRTLFACFMGWPALASLIGLLFANDIHAPARIALLPSFGCPFFPFALAVCMTVWDRSVTKNRVMVST